MTYLVLVSLIMLCACTFLKQEEPVIEKVVEEVIVGGIEAVIQAEANKGK